MMSDKSPIKKTGSPSGSFLRTGCSVLLVAISLLSFSQARLVINNDGYIVINNSAYLVIDNSNANAITELNAGGRIISESETNRVRWNISNATGTYTVPFYEDGEAAEIPVTATVTNPGTAGAANRIDFSTYDGPTFDNVLYMPSGVTNMSNPPVVNNSPKVIDRFWVLDANHTVKPDVTLSFGYVDAEWSAVGNTITEATLEAEYWDNPGSNWTAVPSGTINTGTNVVSSVNATASTFFKYWTLVDAACVTPTVSNAGSNQSVCGTTATLAGNTATAGIGEWTLVSGTGTITNPSSPNSGVTVLGMGPNVFQWTISNPFCTASSSQVTITVIAPPTTSSAGSNQTICGATATLAGNTPATGTGTWTLVSGTGTITTPSSPSSGVTGLGAGANVFQWTIANSPCTASSSTVTITVVDAPTTSNAGADQNLCSTSATFAGNNPTSGTGTWTLVSGAGAITTPSSPTSTVIGLALGANVFQWTISNPPCAPSSSTVTITNTGGATTSNAGANQSICGTTATLAGNTPTTGTGTWTLVSGAGTITTPSSPSSGVTGLGTGANVFQWTIANPPCASSSSTVTVTVVDAPTASNAGTNQSVCGTTATLAGNTPSSGTGTWTLVSGAGTITTPSSPSSGVTGLGAGANVFQWTIANSPCASSSSTVTVTVIDAPTASNAGTNQSVCGTTATLAGNTPSSGTGTWTLVSGAGTITTPSSPSS
ncbi:MAG: hypothetical protein HYU69_05260, partial [Bacteroidetes bacterium]|nr:hypothetical protein [Bacteroidota bacterium]